jgi:hypothetical protein
MPVVKGKVVRLLFIPFLLASLLLGLIGNSEVQAKEGMLSLPAQRGMFQANQTATVTPIPSATPNYYLFKVYFVDGARFNQKNPPYLANGERYVRSSIDPYKAILDEYFKGPGATEKYTYGYFAVYDGFKTYRKLEVANGIARVYLLGSCKPEYVDLNIATLITANLKQFSTVQYVKVYDENDETTSPRGNVDSAPACLKLEPTATPSSTPLPATSTPTPTNTATFTATSTSTNTATNTPRPSATPTVTNTATSTNTATATATSTPTLTPSITPTKTPGGMAVPLETQNGIRLEQTDLMPRQEVFAFIQANPGTLPRPYVTLFGYTSKAGAPVEIRGTINNIKEFICNQTPCILDVEDNTILSFNAISGDVSSDTITANIKVYQQGNDYFVTMTTQVRPLLVQDACATTWNMGKPPDLVWNTFVQSPQDLNTQKKLHYLAYRLISNGLVDASSCPNGGLAGTAPNQCGLEKAFPAIVQWQNQFDFNIWLISRDYRIPPKILKTLMEIESQFWPSNERAYVDEIGLGQVNQLGIDVLLRYNASIYKLACESVLSDCSTPYAYQPPKFQQMIRGALLNTLNARCDTCPQGFDLEKAKMSITLVGTVLQSNCAQAKHLLDTYSETATYEDYWKFTLVSYHSGLGCLQKAVEANDKSGRPMTWAFVSNELKCIGAKDYVDRFWSNLSTFDTGQKVVVNQLDIVKNVPVFAPTAIPKPTATPYVSRARVMVFVVYDENRNGIPEDKEWVTGLPVKILIPGQPELTGTTANGSALFDLTGYTPRTEITVSLPDLSRSEKVILTDEGIMTVVFIINQADLPKILP